MRVIAVVRVAVGTDQAIGLKCGGARRAIPGDAQIDRWKSRADAKLLVLVCRSRIGFVVTPDLVITDIGVWEETEVHTKAVLRQRRGNVFKQELLRALVDRGERRPIIGIEVVAGAETDFRLGQ